MAYFTHHFTATVTLHPVGHYHYTVVYLPGDIARELPFEDSPRLRVEADVGGLAVNGAWQPANGRWYLMLPKSGLRQAGLAVGHSTEVAFRLLPQDQVDLPAELAHLLEQDPAFATAWKAFTPGQQRGLAHRLASAKKAETRVARLAEVRGVVTGLLPPPWRRSVRPGGKPA